MSKLASYSGLRFETIGTAAAILVGVIAIFVSWDQARVMRAQQHASVLPAIQIDGFVNEDNGRVSVGIRLRNNGVGPALIHDFEMQVNGQGVSGWNELTEMAPRRTGRNWSSVTGRVLGQGEEITAIELFWNSEDQTDITALRDFIDDISEKTEIGICYCSVFDRCFISRSDSDSALLPEPVDSCPETSQWINRVELGDPGGPDASPQPVTPVPSRPPE